MSKTELELKYERVKLLERKLLLKEGLPHIYGLKRYPWQQEYCDNKYNKKRILCAANQIGKSTIQICDRIDIATSPNLWPKLWPEQFRVNPQIRPYSWYLYPNQDTVMTEFREKWVPMYLPRNEFKDHEIFGWKEVITNKVLKYLEFNSGYKVYFKTYNQNVHDLQSGTVFAIDCDEETPEDLLPELQARLFATDGYFSQAFTATLGQDFWYRVIERRGEVDEIWPDAFKMQISMYDCLKYVDGSPTVWTPQRIAQVEKNCKNKNEVKRRVYGRFVKDSGLKYPTFERERNLKPYPTMANGKYYKGAPKGWSVYGAADYGSGGDDGHPSAYIFMALSPCMTKIRAFRGRRLDGVETTAGDLYNFYIADAGKMDIASESYDFAAKDFGTIANRAGRPFNKAKKDHELGELALNTALQTGMLVLYFDPNDPLDEMLKLAREFESLLVSTPKKTAKDDFIDAAMYCIMEMPIDWDKVLNGEETRSEKKVKPGSVEERRPNARIWETKKDEEADLNYIEDEFAEWADLL